MSRKSGCRRTDHRPQNSRKGPGPVDGDYPHGAPGMGSLGQLGQAGGNARPPNRSCLRHAGKRKAPALLLSGHQLGDEGPCKPERDLAAAAEHKEVGERRKRPKAHEHWPKPALPSVPLTPRGTFEKPKNP